VPPNNRMPKEADLDGAVLALLHCEDNQQALRQWLNLAIDFSLPQGLADQLERLDGAEREVAKRQQRDG
jgi:hypothetical protein